MADNEITMNLGAVTAYGIAKKHGFTGTEQEWLDSLQGTHANLLDNWCFANPVNQRGQTSWTNPSDWQYSIDRWVISPSSVVALVDGGITITADLQQALEKERLEFGRTYTLSVISSDGRLGKHTFVLTSDMYIVEGFGFGYFVCFVSGNNVWFRIYGDGSTYKAAKLELGSTQTLAHEDANGNWVLNEIPDYGEQLRRCQRYFVCYKAGTFLPCVAYSEQDGWFLDSALPITGMRTHPVNNIGDGLDCSVRNINAESDFISKTISNWGYHSGVQLLRIVGNENTSATWPYIIRMDADLTFSADL